MRRIIKIIKLEDGLSGRELQICCVSLTKRVALQSDNWQSFLRSGSVDGRELELALMTGKALTHRCLALAAVWRQLLRGASRCVALTLRCLALDAVWHQPLCGANRCLALTRRCVALPRRCVALTRRCVALAAGWRSQTDARRYQTVPSRRQSLMLNTPTQKVIIQLADICLIFLNGSC